MPARAEHTANMLKVALGKRSYDIHIGAGLMPTIAGLESAWLAAEKIAVITDENVAELHLKSLLHALGRADVHVIVLPAGEASKSFAVLETVLEDLLEAGFSRSDTLIAFGGGVIGDLTGLVAALLKRGCAFVQIPTTLLAQVDSSVGGKTAINTKAGKNMVGSFYQPASVIIDTDILSTLDNRQMKAGYAEILKYGLIDKPDFFNWLETHGERVIDGEATALRHAITTSCAAKADIVARDERESGERALLNLGHTFAHALEAAGGYDGRILHGEAVSAGLLMAYEFSQCLGLCPGQDVKRVRKHIELMAMPTQKTLLANLKTPAQDLLSFMSRDKKNTGSKITMILARGIGKSFLAPDIDKDRLYQYLQDKTGR